MCLGSAVSRSETIEKAEFKVKPSIDMIETNLSLEVTLNLLKHIDRDVRKGILFHTS